MGKFKEDKLQLKDRDYPLWRETLGRFWELADVLEWKGETKI